MKNEYSWMKFIHDDVGNNVDDDVNNVIHDNLPYFFVVVSIAKLHIETFQVSNIEIPPWLFTLKVKFLLILFLQVTCECEAWSLRSSQRKIKGKNFGGTLLLFFLLIFLFTFILFYFILILLIFSFPSFFSF